MGQIPRSVNVFMYLFARYLDPACLTAQSMPDLEMFAMNCRIP